jgi:hypothetical protein
MDTIELPDIRLPLQQEPITGVINKARKLLRKFLMKRDLSFINFPLIFDKKFNDDS